MSWLTLLILLAITGVIVLVVRSIVRTVRSPQPKFPVFSISMLSVSLVLLIAGTVTSLLLSDALGTAIGSLGGFFGLLESHIRHKREALNDQSV